MQNQEKKQTIQKLWGWGCLSVNCLVVSIYLSQSYTQLPNGGILLSVLPLCYGALKTQRDKRKGDTSIAMIVIEYVCVYIITFLLGFKVASHLCSVAVLIALIIVSLVEMLIFLVITYWYAIHCLWRKAYQKRWGRKQKKTGDSCSS